MRDSNPVAVYVAGTYCDHAHVSNPKQVRGSKWEEVTIRFCGHDCQTLVILLAKPEYAEPVSSHVPPSGGHCDGLQPGNQISVPPHRPSHARRCAFVKTFKSRRPTPGSDDGEGRVSVQRTTSVILAEHHDHPHYPTSEAGSIKE
jgi:hypothetical protein